MSNNVFCLRVTYFRTALRMSIENVSRTMEEIFGLSLLIRSALAKDMETARLNEKYLMERMFLELEKLHMVEDQNGDLKELEITKRQRDILDSLTSISWW